MPTLDIDSDSDTPIPRVATVRIAMPRLDQRFDLRTIEARAHDSHPFTIGPIQLAGLLVEIDLLWRERATLGDKGSAIPSVDIRALDGTVVQVWNAHVGPVDIAGRDIDDDAIWMSAPSDDDLSV